MRTVAPRAFTLVEIMIVVLILGILAVIVLPQFSSATSDSRTAAVMTNLQYLRGQIELFKAQHGGTPPQQGTMWALMETSSSTAETATTSPMGTNFGPYFRSNPVNPWNSGTAVSTAATDTVAGWYYTASATDYDFRIRNADGSVNSSY